LDIMVQTTDAAAARQKLTAGGFRYSGELPIVGSSWTAPDSVTIAAIPGEGKIPITTTISQLAFRKPPYENTPLTGMI